MTRIVLRHMRIRRGTPSTPQYVRPNFTQMNSLDNYTPPHLCRIYSHNLTRFVVYEAAECVRLSRIAAFHRH